MTLRLKKGLAGRLWEMLMIALIGEEYEIVKDVCGIIVSNRFQEDIISVWIASTEDYEMLKEFLKKILGLPHSVLFEFKPHNVSLKDINNHHRQNNSNVTKDFSFQQQQHQEANKINS